MEPVNWNRLPVERIENGVERQAIWGQLSTLARFSFARGAHVSRHSHPSEQFTCVVQGAMRMNLAGQELALLAGDILVIPPHVEHEVWMLEDTVVLDFFTPPRQDWKEGKSSYLAGR